MATPPKKFDPVPPDEAAIVDQFLRKMRPAAPTVVAAPGTRQGAPATGRPAIPPKTQANRRPASGGTPHASVWARVGLGVVVGAALTQWPYGSDCGWRLALYMIAVAVVVLTGLWGALSAWQVRLGHAHVVALIMILWGTALVAHEVLPRVGYARTSATWQCQRE